MIVNIQLNILYFKNRGSSGNDNNIMVDRKDNESIKGKKTNSQKVRANRNKKQHQSLIDDQW